MCNHKLKKNDFVIIPKHLTNDDFVKMSTDVAEGDPDADCRSLAIQSLVLLDKSLKKQLQDQQALSLES